MENRHSPNHPGTALGPVYDDEAHEREKAEFAAVMLPIKERWDALKNELAAIVNKAKAEHLPQYGWMLACLEDADSSVLMLLDEAR